MLNITDIRITKVEGDDKLKAFAALVIEDCFLVGDLRVVEGEDGYFVAMPSRRKRDGSFKDIAYPFEQHAARSDRGEGPARLRGGHRPPRPEPHRAG